MIGWSILVTTACAETVRVIAVLGQSHCASVIECGHKPPVDCGW